MDVKEKQKIYFDAKYKSEKETELYYIFLKLYLSGASIIPATISDVKINSLFKKLRLQKGDLILDVGCGTGISCIPFLKSGGRVIGIDFSIRGVEVARDNIKKFQLQSRFLVADAERLPFKNETFDVISSMTVFEHLARPELAMSEIARVLRWGGG